MGIGGLGHSVVSLRQFSDVVNNRHVRDGDKLDLTRDLYSDKTVSHTGTWRRKWLPASSSDVRRSREIRDALADAIRAEVGSSPESGGKELDRILADLRRNSTPLTKRELRQTLDDVSKFLSKKPEPEKPSERKPSLSKSEDRPAESKLQAEEPKKAEEKPTAGEEIRKKYLFEDGTFKKNAFGFVGGSPEERNAKIDRLIRDEVLPNFFPDLKAKIAELREKTMEALGIDKKLEPWFKKECATLDEESSRFADLVRQTLANGGRIAEISDAIIACCRLHDSFNYKTTDGETVRLNVVLGEGNAVDSDKEKTVFVTGKDFQSTCANYLLARFVFGHETLKDKKVDEVITLDNPLQTLLDKPNQIDAADVAYGEFLAKNVDLDAMVDEIVNAKLGDLKDVFTNEDLAQVKTQVVVSVVSPIRKAQHVWDVEPLSFMHYLTEGDDGIKSADDIRKRLRTAVENLVEDCFVMKNGGKQNGMCLITNTQVKIDQAGMTPKVVIEAAINGNQGLRQKGGNNCFMVSIVNALLGNARGRDVLKNCFCKDDGAYHFKDRGGKDLSVTDGDVAAWEKGNEGAFGKMSHLERVIWTAWLKARYGTPEQQVKTDQDQPGQQCAAYDMAFLFGLENKGQTVQNGVSLPESKLGKWAETRKHLESGQIAIVHEGTAEGGHYEAVVGTDAEGGKSFGCFDSYGSETSFELDSLKVGSGKLETGARRIYLLTLPANENVA